jgi:hypothetical protein
MNTTPYVPGPIQGSDCSAENEVVCAAHKTQAATRIVKPKWWVPLNTRGEPCTETDMRGAPQNNQPTNGKLQTTKRMSANTTRATRCLNPKNIVPA